MTPPLTLIRSHAVCQKSTLWQTLKCQVKSGNPFILAHQALKFETQKNLWRLKDYSKLRVILCSLTNYNEGFQGFFSPESLEFSYFLANWIEANVAQFDPKDVTEHSRSVKTSCKWKTTQTWVIFSSSFLLSWFYEFSWALIFSLTACKASAVLISLLWSVITPHLNQLVFL